MLNKPETYTWYGDKAGTRARNRDWHGSDADRAQAKRMMDLESPDDRKSAQALFDDAFRAANPPMKPLYFS